MRGTHLFFSRDKVPAIKKPADGGLLVFCLYFYFTGFGEITGQPELNFIPFVMSRLEGKVTFDTLDSGEPDTLHHPRSGGTVHNRTHGCGQHHLDVSIREHEESGCVCQSVSKLLLFTQGAQWGDWSMGKASRAKWESRLRVLEDAMRKQYSIKDDGRRWHLSWLISGFIAVATTWATASSGIGMIPLCLVITAATVLSLGLVWVPTPFEKHRAFKGIFSIVLILLSIVGLWWTVTYDRPIFQGGYRWISPSNISKPIFIYVCRSCN